MDSLPASSTPAPFHGVLAPTSNLLGAHLAGTGDDWSSSQIVDFYEYLPCTTVDKAPCHAKAFRSL